MFRPVLRATSVASTASRSAAGRRFASTAASRSGTWRGAAIRWGLAGAGIYYYNTSTAFAEESQFAAFSPPETNHENETYATIDTIAEQRRAQARVQSDSNASIAVAESPSPAGLEEEAEQQGAFNEETGEINWDCPCLGGMANGPCGEQFRAAFSCFVFSKEEPKGVDCIEHFKTMQNCFREHPDVYGGELEDDELAAGEGPEGIQIDDAALAQTQAPPAGEKPAQGSPANRRASDEVSKQPDDRNQTGIETDELVPRAWHNTKDENNAFKADEKK